MSGWLVDRAEGTWRGASAHGYSLELRISVGATLPDATSEEDLISGDLLKVTEEAGTQIVRRFRSTAVILAPPDDGSQAITCPLLVYDAQTSGSSARLDLTFKVVAGETSLSATLASYETVGSTRTEERWDFESLTWASETLRAATVVAQVAAGVERTPLAELLGANGALAACWARQGVTLALPALDELGVEAVDEGAAWDEAELHAAQDDALPHANDGAAWALFLLFATRYHPDGRVLGLMFDDDAVPRQGVAVFCKQPDLVAGGPRELLFTLMHEVGHAFNLPHCFDALACARRGMLPRPAALSWMNYPDRYPFGEAFPTGSAATDRASWFWRDCADVPRFDRAERVHLLHGDTAAVVMGAGGPSDAAEAWSRFVDSPAAPDLTLELDLPDAVAFMELVDVEVTLINHGPATALVPPLHPSAGALSVCISGPGSPVTRAYRPFYRTCVGAAASSPLAAGKRAEESFLLNCGGAGWHVKEPGRYDVQARLLLPDGRSIASRVASFRVAAPSAKHRAMEGVFFTNHVRAYLAVGTSRAAAPSMVEARRAIATIADEDPAHPAFVKIRVMEATRLQRPFRDATGRRKGRATTVLPAQPEAAEQILREAAPALHPRELTSLRTIRALDEVAARSGAEALRLGVAGLRGARDLLARSPDDARSRFDALLRRHGP